MIDKLSGGAALRPIMRDERNREFHKFVAAQEKNMLFTPMLPRAIWFL